MKILLLGKNGQIGWELQRSLVPLGEIIAPDRSKLSTFNGDLNNLSALRETILSVRPDVLVNAAAYTAVDRAEGEQLQVLRINAEAPRVMAESMAELDGWLVHYSTDYVFNGTGQRPWKEEDEPSPLNLYGLSKLKGEQGIRQSGCNHLILRTSWVYGRHGANFVKTMLRLAGEGKDLRIVNDQIGAPTGAELVADLTAHLLRQAICAPECQGVYHLACRGETSWYQYARFIIDTALDLGFSLHNAALQPVPSCDYAVQAARPLNSRLDTSRLCQQFKLHLPCWQTGVVRMLAELKGLPS